MIPKSAPDPALDRRRTLLWVIGAVTAVSVTFRILASGGLQHTSLVFIGIPAILAIVLAVAPTPKSATGLILKAMTLALLVAAVLLGEAMVCVLFAAPLFYAVGIVVGLFADFMRVRNRKGIDGPTITVLAIVLGSASLEGVVPELAFERHNAVTAARVVQASAEDVRAALARTPRFDRERPFFLTLGFPAPGTAAGSGLAVGDRRAIELRHGRHPGTLTLRVRRSEPGHIEFEPIADDSYIVHWLSLTRSDVRWIEVAPGATLVTWTLEYRRRLDPAWYFAPLERYGTTLAAGYLIDAVATPARETSAARAGGGRRVFDLFCRGLGLTRR